MKRESFLSLFILLFSTLHCSTVFSQKNTISTSDQEWFQYYNQISFDKKNLLLTEGSFRLKNGFSEKAQYMARIAYGRMLRPQLRISVGFANFGTFSNGNLAKMEFRPHQELFIKGDWYQIKISHRFRIEERFFNPVIDGSIGTPNTFNLRFRYAFVSNIPIAMLSKKKEQRQLELSLGDELLVNAGKNIVNNVFDQNRFMIGPSVNWTKDLKTALIWSANFSATTAPHTYLFTNVFWLQIKHSISLKKANE